MFVPTADGRLVALDAATGGRSWTASTGVELGVQPAVAGGVVFTGSDDGALHAFAAAGCGSATCEPLWTTSTGSSAVSGGQLYVGTADGQVIAYGLPRPARFRALGSRTRHPTVSHPSRAARLTRWRLSGSLVVRRAASW